MSREDDIIQIREIPYPYSIDQDELIARFEQCYVAAIHDVMSSPNVEGNMNLPNTWLGPEITCRTKELNREAVAGFAFTIQWIKDPLPDEREFPAAKMLDSYFKNSILIVDTGGDKRSGYLGELNTNLMMRKGVRGSVIDGGARDSGFVRLMNFPVFCKFTSPIDAFAKNRLRGFQIPITINGVRIDPMDIIVGDSDGVIIIPQAVAETVLVKLESRKAAEDKSRDLIISGMSALDVAKKTGGKEL